MILWAFLSGFLGHLQLTYANPCTIFPKRNTTFLLGVVYVSHISFKNQGEMDRVISLTICKPREGWSTGYCVYLSVNWCWNFALNCPGAHIQGCQPERSVIRPVNMDINDNFLKKHLHGHKYRVSSLHCNTWLRDNWLGVFKVWDMFSIPSISHLQVMHVWTGEFCCYAMEDHVTDVAQARGITKCEMP